MSLIQTPHTMRLHYTAVAKSLHWLMALLIMGMLALGFFMTGLPLSPDKFQYYAWHKWAGVSVFGLVWLRLAWRLMFPPPALQAGMSRALKLAAHAGHWALYALMVLIPLTGWLMSSAKGFQTVWFGVLPLPDLLGKDKLMGNQLALLHWALNVSLLALIVGHAAAALWHHFVHRDDTLRRMLPVRATPLD